MYRYRIPECEPCHRCGAERGRKCRDYKGRSKARCDLRDLCVRCRAQYPECRCGGPYVADQWWGRYREYYRLFVQQEIPCAGV